MSENRVSTKEARRLLLSHNVVIAGRALFSIFLNVFIWKETGDIVLLSIFNTTYILVHTASFHGAALFVKSGKVHQTRVLSLAGLAVAYTTIFILGETTIQYLIPLAVALGLFNGMYWISYHVLRYDLTHRANRGNYTGLEHGSNIFVNIIMPVLGGAIVTADFFGLGYANLFLLGAVLFLTALALGNVSYNIIQTPGFHLRKTFALIRNDPDMLKAMFVHTISAFGRGGTVAKLLLPLLIFDVLKNEFQLGGWLSFFSIVAIVASVAIGRFIAYRNYKKLAVSGGVLYFSLAALVIVYPSFWVLLAFGALVKVLDLFINIPKRVMSENLIAHMPDSAHHRIEFIVIREWFNIGIGRALSLIVLLFVTDMSIEGLKIFFFIMAFAVIAEVLILKSMKRAV